MSTQPIHPREELVATMQRIYRQRMTTTSGGNLSILDSDGRIWITPAGVDKGSLTPADIVSVGPDGRADGAHPPSSELPFHREVYRRRPDIRAIVHAHPGALVAFSICHKIPDTRFRPDVHRICGRVALASYACTGTQALGDSIAATFASGADCVLLENHGVVIGGRDLRDACQRFETLEFAAQTLIRAATLGPLQVLQPEALVLEAMPEYEQLPPCPLTAIEQDLRASICRFVQRADRQKLLTGTADAFSTRLNESEFLITPHRHDRLEIQAEDLVRVRHNACSAGQHPCHGAPLHAAIYARIPGVGAIINAQPVHVSAFCVTATPLSTYTIPESYIVLNEVPKLPFRRSIGDAAEIAAHLSLEKTPVLLIANAGAVVIGRTLLQAFDRLEVLEATTEALLLARPLGSTVPLSTGDIAELRQALHLA